MVVSTATPETGHEPASPAMGKARRAWLDLATGISLANIMLLSTWSYLFTIGTDQSYWMQASGFDYVAAAANVVVLGLLFFAAARLVHRARSRALANLAHVALLLVLLVPLDALRRELALLSVARSLARFPPWGRMLLLVAVLVGVGWIVRRWHRRIFAGLRIGLLLLFPFALVTLGRAAWTVAQERPDEVLGDLPVSGMLPLDPSPRPRVVVLLFDELDQRVAFSERPQDLALPEFDRLQEHSLVASQAYSPAEVTLQAIPALLTGERVLAARPAGPRSLMLQVADSSDAISWSTFEDLFSDARSLGFNTGVVGWYHPYCRVLRDRLSQCAWHASGDGVPRHARNELLGAMWYQLINLSPWGRRATHAAAHRWLLDRARGAVRHPDLDLVFVHLAVPHFPWIYDRRSEEFSFNRHSFSGYLDNLALADRALGDLRRAMEDAGTWEASTVLVTSDHFWRDAAELDGRVDARVPFLLKLPLQRERVDYARRLNTILLRELVAELLNGDIATPAGAAAWLDGQSSGVNGKTRLPG